MSSNQGWPRRIFSMLLAVLTAAGLYNVFSDNSAVRKLAERTACGSEGCSVTQTREARNPIAQTFAFQTRNVQAKTSAGGAVVEVKCQRQLWFFGEYSCSAVSD